MDGGKRQDGSGKNSVCNRKKKGGSRMGGKRKNSVFKQERNM